jgi:two-component system sensor histidine kinase KdpD
LVWTAVLAAATLALLAFRAQLDKAHVAMVLLLVVLGAGAKGGRALGIGIGIASFLDFDWFFLSPYGTLRVSNPLDWIVLISFLITSVVAAQLLHREQEARRRAEADALKDALIASISHDLRTPLTTIKALAHQLGDLGDERSQMIEEQADRLNRYVVDLLDLSRLDAGAMPVRLELNAVDDLLSAVVQEAEAHLGGRPLDVALSSHDPLLVGRFDLGHSARVLVNLIENANKYSPVDAPILVTARRADDTLRITVMDRGPGVPEAEVERIFTPFYRAGGVPSDTLSAGLGLSLARRMAELQGGSVAYAPREGGGSAFSLILPAAELHDAEEARRVAQSFVKS